MNRIALITIVFTALFASCHSSNDNSDESPRSRTSVTVVHPIVQTLTHYLDLNGITQYQRKETIRATATGYLSSLKVLPGNSVSEGEIVATISTKEQKALEQIDSLNIKSLI